MLPWQLHIHQLLKSQGCVVNLLAAIFGNQRIKDFREKGERNIGIKNCVQSLIYMGSKCFNNQKRDYFFTRIHDVVIEKEACFCHYMYTGFQFHFFFQVLLCTKNKKNE